jgi:hypothetical protein
MLTRWDIITRISGLPPVDLSTGKIKVKNENFFRDLSNYQMVYTLVVDGKAVQTGSTDHLNIAPQQTVTYTLPYSLSGIDKKSEVLLNIEFKLKTAEPLMDAGQTVAYNQMVVQDYDFARRASCRQGRWQTENQGRQKCRCPRCERQWRGCSI